MTGQICLDWRDATLLFARLSQQRVTAGNGGRSLVVDGEIAPSVPLESLTSNQMIDVNQGMRPDPRTAAVLVQPNADLGILPPPVSAPVPNADQTASAGIPPTVPMPGTLNPEIGRNDFGYWQRCDENLAATG